MDVRCAFTESYLGRSVSEAVITVPGETHSHVLSNFYDSWSDCTEYHGSKMTNTCNSDESLLC